MVLTTGVTIEFISSVSPKGQITLPAELRARLGVKPRDKVAITLDEQGEEIRVVPVGSGLEASFQAVPALEKHLTLKQIREIAREEQAKQAAGEGLER